MRAATGLDALAAAVGDPDHTEEIIDALLAAASADPAGFRLLFHHAPREPAGGSGAGRRRTGLEDLPGERLRRPGRGAVDLAAGADRDERRRERGGQLVRRPTLAATITVGIYPTASPTSGSTTHRYRIQRLIQPRSDCRWTEADDTLPCPLGGRRRGGRRVAAGKDQAQPVVARSALVHQGLFDRVGVVTAGRVGMAVRAGGLADPRKVRVCRSVSHRIGRPVVRCHVLPRRAVTY